MQNLEVSSSYLANVRGLLAPLCKTGVVSSPVLGEEMRSGESEGQWALKVRTAFFCAAVQSGQSALSSYL